MYKMIIIVRNDLKLPKGKLAVQASHAAVDCALKAYRNNKPVLDEWREEGAKKVLLKVDKLDSLFYFKTIFDQKQITTSLIRDAGKTVLEPGTITVLGAGPEKEEVLDKYIKDLKLI